MVVIKRKNPGWLEKLLARYRNESELAIGWPAGSRATSIRYPDGTSVVLVAAVNNFGSQSRGIPARPFMTESQAPAIAATAPVAAKLMPQLNAGRISAAEILERMGPFAVGAFQTTITDFAWTPNAASTVADKKSSKPLLDTGLMRSSLTYVVRKPR